METLKRMEINKQTPYWISHLQETEIISCFWHLKGDVSCKKKKTQFSIVPFITIISAEQYIVPPAGLPNQGLLKKYSAKLAFT